MCWISRTYCTKFTFVFLHRKKNKLWCKEHWTRSQKAWAVLLDILCHSWATWGIIFLIKITGTLFHCGPALSYTFCMKIGKIISLNMDARWRQQHLYGMKGVQGHNRVHSINVCAPPLPPDPIVLTCRSSPGLYFYTIPWAQHARLALLKKLLNGFF